MTRVEWIHRGRELAAIASRAHWDLGDWANAGDRWDLDIAADEVGLSRASLRRLAWLARCFPPRRRVPGLTYSHHEGVGALPAPDADRLLAAARAEGWSVNRLREAVSAERDPAERQLTLPLELAPTGDAWRRDALQIERSVRRHVRAAGGELQAAFDEIAILGDHPGREAAHGNTVQAVVRRLAEWRDALAPHHRADLDKALANIEGRGSAAARPAPAGPSQHLAGAGEAQPAATSRPAKKREAS